MVDLKEFNRIKDLYFEREKEYREISEKLRLKMGESTKEAAALANIVKNSGKYLTDILEKISDDTENVSESLTEANTRLIKDIDEGSSTQKETLMSLESIERELYLNDARYNDIRLSNVIADTIQETAVIVNKSVDEDGDPEVDPWDSEKMMTDTDDDVDAMLDRYRQKTREMATKIAIQKSKLNRYEEKRKTYEKIKINTKANLQKKINEEYKTKIQKNASNIDSKLAENMTAANQALESYSTNTAQIMENEQVKKVKNDSYKVYIKNVRDLVKQVDADDKINEEAFNELDVMVKLAKIKADKIVGNADVQYSQQIEEMRDREWNLAPGLAQLAKELAEM